MFNGDSLLNNRELLKAVREAKEGKFEEDSSSFTIMLSVALVIILLCTALFLLYPRRKKRGKTSSQSKAYLVNRFFKG